MRQLSLGRSGPGKLGMPTTKQRIYMCDACEVSSRVQNTGELDSEFLDVATVFDRRIEANRHNDWAALILASFVVALAASSEVRTFCLSTSTSASTGAVAGGAGLLHEFGLAPCFDIPGMCMNLPLRCAPLITVLAALFPRRYPAAVRILPVLVQSVCSVITQEATPSMSFERSCCSISRTGQRDVSIRYPTPAKRGRGNGESSN